MFLMLWCTTWYNVIFAYFAYLVHAQCMRMVTKGLRIPCAYLHFELNAYVRVCSSSIEPRAVHEHGDGLRIPCAYLHFESKCQQ